MLERLFLLIGKYPLNMVSHVCSFLPIILGLVYFRCLSKSYKLALLLFVLYFVSDTWSLWLVMARVSTFSIQNLQPLFETVIIMAVYLHSFDRRESKTYIKMIAALGAIVIAVSYQQQAISTVGLTTQRLLVTLIVLFYFNKVVGEARVDNILFHSMFWLSSGLLIYAAGTFFFSLFSAYIYSVSSSNSEFDLFWKLNQILYIILCLMASVGVWVCRYDTRGIVN